MAKPASVPCVDCRTLVAQRTGPGRIRWYCDACGLKRDQRHRAESNQRLGLTPVPRPLIRCSDCDVEFGALPDQDACAACRRRRRQRHRRTDKQRAIDAGVEYEFIDRNKVYERDHWRCGLCGDRVSRRLRVPDPMGASLDHIVPISQGGPHLYANVQLAHFVCNTRKGVGGQQQLRLVG